MTDAAPLSLFIPETPVDPARLADEFDRLGPRLARNLAWVHNTLVETAGDAAGRRPDVVKRFAAAHGATAAAADRFVLQWKLCRDARDGLTERIGAWRPIDTLMLGAAVPRLANALNAAKADGLKAVLSFLIGMTAEGCGIRDAQDLATFLDVAPAIRTPHAMAAALTALIGLGCVSVEPEAAGWAPGAEEAEPSVPEVSPAAPTAGQMELALSDKTEESPAPVTPTAVAVPPSPSSDEAQRAAAEDEDEEDEDEEASDESDHEPIVWGFDDERLSQTLSEEPITLESIRKPLIRLGKKTKRLYAWVHNQLVAAIGRQMDGFSPQELASYLRVVDAQPQTVERAVRQWKEVLNLRDALEPMARSLNPSSEEARRGMMEAFRRSAEEMKPLVRLLQFLLELFTFLCHRKNVHDLLCRELEDAPEGIKIACRCVLLAMGGEALLQETEKDEAEEEDETEEEASSDEETPSDETSVITPEELCDEWPEDEKEFKQWRLEELKKANRWVERCLPSLSDEQLLLFVFAMEALCEVWKWLLERDSVFARVCREVDSDESTCCLAGVVVMALLTATAAYVKKNQVFERKQKHPLSTNASLAEAQALQAACDFQKAFAKLDELDVKACQRCMKAINLVRQAIGRLTDKQRSAAQAAIRAPFARDHFDGYLYFLEQLARAILAEKAALTSSVMNLELIKKQMVAMTEFLEAQQSKKTDDPAGR